MRQASSTAKSRDPPGGRVTQDFTYTYNSKGKMVTASDDAGTYDFTYNAAGEVATVSEPFGVSLTFGYDSAGNRTSVADSYGGETDSVYNSSGQLVSETYSEDGVVLLEIDQTFNKAGQVATQIRYSDAGVTEVAETDFTYNAAGEVTDILTTSASGATIDEFAYTYSGNGQLVTETDNGTLVGTYTYDQSGPATSNNAGIIGQLIGDGTNSYVYDPAGNRTGTGYIIGPGNQLLSDGAYNYTYDPQGNEITKTNIATGDEWTYGYDAGNEMISAVETASGGTIETQVEYTYDAFGNRVEVDVTQGGVTTVTRYGYDMWNPAKAGAIGTSGSDIWATFDSSGSLTSRQIQGDGIDQHFASISDGNVSWYVTDRLGSVRDVVDNTGTVQDAISYDVWGNITSETNPSARGLYAWTGRELDVETGLQYNRARYYDPQSGRWMSQDPMGFDAGDSNLYRYVSNNPTNATDSSGDVIIFIHGVNDNGAEWMEDMFQGMKNKWTKDGSQAQIALSFSWRTFKEKTPHPVNNATRTIEETWQNDENANATKQLQTLINQLRRKIPENEPIFLVAHSEGTMIALSAIAGRGDGRGNRILQFGPAPAQRQNNLDGVKVENVILMNTPLHIRAGQDLLAAANNARMIFSYWDPNDRIVTVEWVRNGGSFNGAPGLGKNSEIIFTESQKSLRIMTRIEQIPIKEASGSDSPSHSRTLNADDAFKLYAKNVSTNANNLKAVSKGLIWILPELPADRWGAQDSESHVTVKRLP